VTDTQEQLPVAPAAAGPAAQGTAAPARARRASLNTMLLSELQQLAGGMGINTTKLKKSDLVAAIKAAQGGGASAEPKAKTTARDSHDGAPSQDALPTEAPARQTRAKGAPTNETETAPAETAPADGAPTESGQRPERRRARNADRNVDRGADRAAQSNGPAEREQTRERGQNDQTRDRSTQQNNDRGERVQNNQGNQGGQNNQGNPNRDRNDRGQNNQSNQNNQSSQNNQNQNQNNDRDDDDYEGGRRRGRRYRDRRGRNRERGPNPQGGGNTDVEPTVSEDDVLVPVAGVLDEIADKNTWFVRTGGYYASPEDVYVANSYVRRFNLRRGDAVTGAIKQQREGDRREKYNPLVRLDTVNGRPAEENSKRVEFTRLTPLYPQERLRLETEPHILTTRVIDLVMPIGKGQRALIVSPPKAGKTMVLQSIANAIATNNPEVHLMVVLIDERPEEVTDMQRSVKGEVIASTFDRRPQDHITVAELSIERAKRLVELGHDVVVLLDSITRLGRAYNLGAPASGRILSGGVDSTALYPPKRFLGAARNIENGGSLTILATALVETGSAGDTVIFEEFKGTGNAELKLDRKIADKRIFPAVDVDQSSTRKEEILLSPDELAVTIKLRRVLHELESQQAINLLLDRLKKSRTNLEFLMQIAKTTPGQDNDR
jgi:transcription termination factor Rho